MMVTVSAVAMAIGVGLANVIGKAIQISIVMMVEMKDRKSVV